MNYVKNEETSAAAGMRLLLSGPTQPSL